MRKEVGGGGSYLQKLQQPYAAIWRRNSILLPPAVKGLRGQLVKDIDIRIIAEPRAVPRRWHWIYVCKSVPNIFSATRLLRKTTCSEFFSFFLPFLLLADYISFKLKISWKKPFHKWNDRSNLPSKIVLFYAILCSKLTNTA